MENNNFKDLGMPKLDISYTAELASNVQQQFAENRKREIDDQIRIAEKVTQEKRRTREALERTATNTEETNTKLSKIIEQQSDYISLLKETNESLKEQLLMQKTQLEFSERQLMMLKNIFVSSEDGVAVEREITEIIQRQIDTSHPLWEYVKDKGGDIAVSYGLPVLYNTLKIFLASKGIQLP